MNFPDRITQRILVILAVLTSSASGMASIPFCSYASGISSHAGTGFREKPVNQTDKLVYKSDKPVNKTDNPVYKSENPVNKTENPVNQTDKLVYKSDKPVNKTENPVYKTDKPVYKIVTVDGRNIMGALLYEDEATVTIEVEGLGELTIRKENIQSIQQLEEDAFVDGRYWFPNPHATRHLFAPNAIPLKKGAGYYQNTWIFFNNLNYGVSDRFSVGVGMVPIFLFGVRALPIWLLPKYSIPIKADKWHISAGGMIGGVIASDGIAAGVLYSTVTYGNRDRNITGGIGFGFSNDGIGDRPVLNLSGMYRLSVKTYLITENYFFSPDDGYDALWSFGMRYALESFSIDFALLRPSGTSGGFIGIPWLGIALPLNY